MPLLQLLEVEEVVSLGQEIKKLAKITKLQDLDKNHLLNKIIRLLLYHHQDYLAEELQLYLEVKQHKILPHKQLQITSLLARLHQVYLMQLVILHLIILLLHLTYLVQVLQHKKIPLIQLDPNQLTQPLVAKVDLIQPALVQLISHKVRIRNQHSVAKVELYSVTQLQLQIQIKKRIKRRMSNRN